jgi:carbamoyltransferase
LGGASRNACVTLCTPDRILGICEQERVTRVRAAGFNATGLPDEALDELLRRSGRVRRDIVAYLLAESAPTPPGIVPVRIDHHFAHACSAFFPSEFESATIVVCDHESPQVSVWEGSGTTITRVDWPWQGIGFAELYSQCADALGFTAGGREQRMEALARLEPRQRDDVATGLFALGAEGIRIPDDWRARLDTWVGSRTGEQLAPIAAALQNRIGELLVQFLAAVRERSPAERALCVGGSLFYNSHLNSQVKLGGGFDHVFIPVNPGNAGLSVGAALHASGVARRSVTPFLGPAYTSEDIKATLDNCKLTYQWASEPETVAIAVDALQKGRLIAWFDGPMEWGARALGARSILANPFAPYVLDNLNRFLKQREVWRGYAVSALDSAVHEHFAGPESSPFMECDYEPRDRERFRHILPGPNANIRVQTVGADAPPRFRSLIHAFGEATGMPMLVNTSFNGFREPIVCSPRDAVRVFFGTGLDLLLFGEFVISK